MSIFHPVLILANKSGLFIQIGTHFFPVQPFFKLTEISNLSLASFNSPLEING
jgi:hypothetical protein